MLTNILKLSWFGIRPTTNRILKLSQNDTVALGKPTCECLSHVDLGFHQRKWFNYEQWVNLGVGNQNLPAKSWIHLAKKSIILDKPWVNACWTDSFLSRFGSEIFDLVLYTSQLFEGHQRLAIVTDDVHPVLSLSTYVYTGRYTSAYDMIYIYNIYIIYTYIYILYIQYTHTQTCGLAQDTSRNWGLPAFISRLSSGILNDETLIPG